MANVANVLFKVYQRAAWEEITPVESTFYRVINSDDSEDFYLGSKHLNNQSDIDAAIAALDGSATIASKSGDVVTIKTGITEADGVVDNDSGTDIVLEEVAVTGAAADVSVADASGYFTSTDVEGVLAELAQASSGGVSSKTVYITETAGQSGDAFSKRYGIYQGANGSSSSPVVGEKLADIDIPKDMFVEEGSVVDITYSEGHLYDGVTDVTELIKGAGGTATAADAGKYIKLIIANATSSTLYIAAADLVDIYTAEQNASQVQIAIDNNNVISATIVAGSIDTTELADGAVTTAKLDDEAVTTAKIDDEAVTTAKIDDEAVTLGKLASGVQTSLGLADSAVQSVTASDPTTGTDGTFEVDGTEVAIKGLGSAAYTASSAYDPAGSASTAESNAEDYARGLLVWEVVTPAAGD